MAHICPKCKQICRCTGDTEDSINDFMIENYCTHHFTDECGDPKKKDIENLDPGPGYLEPLDLGF